MGCIPSDYIGYRFGKLVATEFGRDDVSEKYLHVLTCDCGNNIVAHISPGKTTPWHCGCESLSNHPIYPTWHSMKSRCYNENNVNYPWYGGKGVKVCDAWKKCPSIFIRWMEENGWHKGLNIDRINPAGNYEPSNCQLLTKSENSKKCRPRGSVTNHNKANRNYQGAI